MTISALPGDSWASRRAAVKPAKPAPMITIRGRAMPVLPYESRVTPTLTKSVPRRSDEGLADRSAHRKSPERPSTAIGGIHVFIYVGRCPHGEASNDGGLMDCWGDRLGEGGGRGDQRGARAA